MIYLYVIVFISVDMRVLWKHVNLFFISFFHILEKQKKSHIVGQSNSTFIKTKVIYTNTSDKLCHIMRSEVVNDHDIEHCSKAHGSNTINYLYGCSITKSLLQDYVHSYMCIFLRNYLD